MFQAEMGPALEPHWGRERLSDGGRWKPSLPIGDHCQIDWFLCQPVKRPMAQGAIDLFFHTL